MDTKEFATADVLSTVTGRIVSKIDGVYQVLNWMTGENLFTHQLPRVSREARPVLVAAHPILQQAVDEAAQVTTAHLNALIATAERDMVEAIERWGKDDKEYARRRSEEYYMAIEPLRRERDAVIKVIADYYDLQPMPPQIVCRPSTPPDTPPRTAAGTHTPEGIKP